MSTNMSITDNMNDQDIIRTGEIETATDIRTSEDVKVTTDPDGMRISISATAPQVHPATIDTESPDISINDDTRQFIRIYVSFVFKSFHNKIEQAARNGEHIEAKIKQGFNGRSEKSSVTKSATSFGSNFASNSVKRYAPPWGAA